MKRILITGASGFLGSHLYKVFNGDYVVFGTCYTQTITVDNFIRLNLEDKDEIFRVLSEIKPSYVIHNAAVSNPDKAETDKETAKKVNLESTKVIVNWCHRNKAKLCFISTDQVFDGKSSYYKETDPVSPVNYYGITKVKAEKIVLEGESNAIFRMALMYGRSAFRQYYKPEWIWGNFSRRKKIKVFVDQYRSVLCVNNAAELVKKAVDIDFSGILHLGGPERVSRYDMAKAICRYRGISTDLLEPVRHGQVDLLAPRPQDVSLDISKAKSVLKIPIFSINESLRRYL